MELPVSTLESDVKYVHLCISSLLLLVYLVDHVHVLESLLSMLS